MTGFSADWLSLREGADARARDPELVARLAAYLSGRGRVRVLDLGSGTGASLRALGPTLGAEQHWVLADDDPDLLARAEASRGVTLERRLADLGPGLAALFDPAPDLVTASALFDLCGAAWLEGLVAQVAGCGAALYAALTYDGREAWHPPHTLDAEVLAAFHADQHRDKGLGPALGLEAHDRLAACLSAQGYRVSEARSDWALTRPADAALIAALAKGTAAAVAPGIGAERSEVWHAARAGADEVSIGHRDLLALPSGRRPGAAVSPVHA